MDPGLDPAGKQQAETMAAGLAPGDPFDLLTSPFRRTRETAAAIERRWGMTAAIEPRVGEIPSPSTATGRRAEWLKSVLQGRWPEMDSSLHLWRHQVRQALAELARNTVVVSHFVVINVAVGYALNDDRVTVFHPENCSCTVIDVEHDAFHVVELGAEGPGRIL
jgi:broad specificity phosphatase PhoE